MYLWFFPYPKTLVKTLAKNQVKNLAKSSSDKLFVVFVGLGDPGGGFDAPGNGFLNISNSGGLPLFLSSL